VFCARIHGVVKQKINTTSQSSIDACGLGEVRNRLIKNLSKGYQQRVGIAQAILHSPPVIILDEPTVGLDPIQILEIRRLIKTLGENHGIILCTHILPEVQAVCNRVQIINKGELVYSAGIDEILNQESTRFDISFASEISSDILSSHSIFTTIKKVDSKHFIIESDLSANKLIEYIVQQQWGLIQFTQQQASLEQIFINLTLTDANIVDSSPMNTSTTEQEKVA
jgi:ABC-2 type transport system ATP-binding protein